MRLRLLSILLVILNILAGYHLIQARHRVHAILPAADPGIEKLRLLSELPATDIQPLPSPTASAPAAVASLAVAASTHSPVAPLAFTSTVSSASSSRTCVSLGPFATRVELRMALLALQKQSIGHRIREQQVAQKQGWWVYLPASSSRRQAFAEAKKLDAHGIVDYFVVTGGDRSNTISLGLFKDPDNARRRRKQVMQAGFPAQLIHRTENIPEYWLDIALAREAPLVWQHYIHAHGINSHAIPCF
jgi:hypothetical protein